MIAARPPAPPRTVDRRIDRGLETICLSCLEKDPARRYPSAGALTKDLERVYCSQPIVARPRAPAVRARGDGRAGIRASRSVSGSRCWRCARRRSPRSRSGAWRPTPGRACWRRTRSSPAVRPARCCSSCVRTPIASRTWRASLCSGGSSTAARCSTGSGAGRTGGGIRQPVSGDRGGSAPRADAVAGTHRLHPQLPVSGLLPGGRRAGARSRAGRIRRSGLPFGVAQRARVRAVNADRRHRQ